MFRFLQATPLDQRSDLPAAALKTVDIPTLSCKVTLPFFPAALDLATKESVRADGGKHPIR